MRSWGALDRPPLNILRANTCPPSPHVTTPIPSAEIATFERSAADARGARGIDVGGRAEHAPGVRAAIQPRDPHVAVSDVNEANAVPLIDRSTDGAPPGPNATGAANAPPDGRTTP